MRFLLFAVRPRDVMGGKEVLTMSKIKIYLIFLLN